MDWCICSVESYSLCTTYIHRQSQQTYGALFGTVLVTMASVPCIVVSVVDSDGVAEAGKRSVQLLCQNKLVTQQSVGVRKARVHLRDRQDRGEKQVERSERETGEGKQKHKQVERQVDISELVRQVRLPEPDSL